jgi:hypothetical protein
MNIYQKINEVRKAIDYIKKDRSVSTGGGSYRAVSHDAVTAILRKHLVEQGLICVPTLIKSETHPKEEGSKQFRYDATYSFEFVSAEAPSEKVTIVIEAHAMDNADKAPGKAISYAKKYAVLKLFEIETGEDEESRYPDLELLSKEKFDQFCTGIRACITTDKAKDEWRKGLAACEKLGDVGSANLLKQVLLDHAEFIDKAAK